MPADRRPERYHRQRARARERVKRIEFSACGWLKRYAASLAAFDGPATFRAGSRGCAAQVGRLYYRLWIAGLCGELREGAREMILRRQLERSYDLRERNLAELHGAGACCLFEASGFREHAVQLHRGARWRRWCERSASSSASSQGRLEGRWAISAAARQGSSAHAVGFSRSHPCTQRRRGSHLEQLRRVFLSILTI